MNFVCVEDQAFGEEFIEKVVDKADGFGALIYIPYQELVVQGGD